MTLVLDERLEGPATHALIIGYESPSQIESGSFSPAVTAHKIADLLLSLEIVDAPLASVDLHASYSPYTKASYQSPRDGISHHSAPPNTESLEAAIRRWRERLDGNEDNIGLFYFVGPVAEEDSEGAPITLLVPGGMPGLWGFDLEALWVGLAASNARRQLFFVDSCPSGAARPADTDVVRPELGGTPRTDMLRTLYVARMPPRTASTPGSEASPLSQALIEVLGEGEAVDTGELADRLDGPFARRLAKADYTDIRTIEAGIEGDFAFRYRAAPPDQTADQARGTPADELGDPASTGQARRPEAARMDIGSDGVTREGSESESEAVRLQTEALLRDRVGRLTRRQRESLRLVSGGLTHEQIAKRLKIAPATVQRHLDAAVEILQVPDIVIGAQLLAAFGDAADRAKPRPPRPKTVPSTSPGPRAGEPDTHFVSDDPEIERDELGRGPLAIALGRRLHRIWCRSNGIKVPGSTEDDGASLDTGDERAAFVLHLDAPWGGGKTSFANFLARVLNPFPAGSKAPANFLVERAGPSNRVGTIFIDDPPANGQSGRNAADWPEEARRPWIIVPFNAWQAEHCAPPWWVFYQAIRKGCFRSVWREGMAASVPNQSRPSPRPFIEERLWNSARLWRRELWWRLRNPKVLVPLATALVAGALVLVLLQLGLVFRSRSSADFNLSNATGLLLAAVTGIGSIWAAAALFTESLAPGLDAAAERRNLGSGDPFERFRRHFARTMAAVKRPVMVIVDDLDRCRPDFVVDLVRGIQTLLKSPRVVFVILGDRDWIERAFEAHHDAMKRINVGPEQTFGARFVEKAIQMSFILPEMPDARQDAYVRKVLIGPGAAATGPDAPPPPSPDVAQRFRADYREKVATAPTAAARKKAEEKLVEKYQPELQAAMEPRTAAAAGSEAPDTAKSKLATKTAAQQASKLAGEERALLAAVDERMGQALLHRLEPLARFFPANPRQIKRIVNAITMYTCVAYLQMDMDESDSLGLELAVWVIVMTEWPDSWRLLASCPELADVLAAEDHEKALATVPEDRLPGSRASTLREVKRIRTDARLLALITEQSPQRPRLRTESVRRFTELTPLYSRLRRLKDEGEAAPAPSS